MFGAFFRGESQDIKIPSDLTNWIDHRTFANKAFHLTLERGNKWKADLYKGVSPGQNTSFLWKYDLPKMAFENWARIRTHSGKAVKFKRNLNAAVYCCYDHRFSNSSSIDPLQIRVPNMWSVFNSQQMPGFNEERIPSRRNFLNHPEICSGRQFVNCERQNINEAHTLRTAKYNTSQRFSPHAPRQGEKRDLRFLDSNLFCKYLVAAMNS